MPSLLSRYSGNGSLLSRYTQPQELIGPQRTVREFAPPVNWQGQNTNDLVSRVMSWTGMMQGARGNPEQQSTMENLGREALSMPLGIPALGEQLIQRPLETGKSLLSGTLERLGNMSEATFGGIDDPQGQQEAIQRIKIDATQNPLSFTLGNLGAVTGAAQLPSMISRMAGAAGKVSKVPRMLSKIDDVPHETAVTPSAATGEQYLGAFGDPNTATKFMTGTSELNKAWEGFVDNVKARIASKIPQGIKNKLSYEAGRPEVWEKAKLDRTQNITSGIDETLELSKVGKGQFSESTYGKAYDYLDPTERGTAKPTDLFSNQKTALDDIRNAQTKLSNEAVEVGIIDKEIVDANAGDYLRRYYEPHEGKWDNRLKGVFRSFRIKGNKKRYLDTPEARMEAGIKRDPFYSFAKSSAAQRHDIETGRLFAKMAESPEFAPYVSDTPKAGFATKPIPNSYQYGKLKNKYVSQAIYDDVMEISRPFDQSEMSRIYGKLLGVWKAGKTAWNPATHGRNIFSSAVQNDIIAGLSPTRVDKYVNAIKGMAKSEDTYKDFNRLGGGEGTFSTEELTNFLGEVNRSQGSMLNRSLDRMLESKVARPLQSMSKAYQMEEIVFRYAAFKHRLSLGESAEQAMKIAKKAIPDYSQVPDIIRKARRSPVGVPFISYPYKMLPAIADEAIKHPLRAGKYAIMFKAINEFAKQNLGMTDAEYDELKKSKNFNGGSQILLPFTDKAGDPEILDLTYNMPFGDFLEWGGALGGTFGQGEGGVGVKDKALSMLSPVAKTAIELGANRNTYTGRDLATTSMSKTDQAKAYGKQLWNTAAPTVISRSIPNIIKAAMGEKDFAGKERDLPTTVLSNVLGISIKPLNKQSEATGRRIEFKKVIEDYQRRIVNAAIKQDQKEVERLVKEYNTYISNF